MGKRIEELAGTLIRHRNRRRLRLLLRKHRYLLSSHSASLLFIPLWRNDWEMLRWLLERGVLPDCRLCSPDSATPLMHAACDGQVTAIRLLIEFGADINALTDNNEHALGYAVAWEQPDSVRALAEAGMDVNDMRDSGPLETELDRAEFGKFQEVAAVLRGFGAKRFAELSWSDCWKEGDLISIEIEADSFAIARVLTFPTLTFYAALKSRRPSSLDGDAEPAFSVWTHWSACTRPNWTRIASKALTEEEKRVPLPYHRDPATGWTWLVRGPRNLVRKSEDECRESEAALFWSPSEVETRLHDLHACRPNELHRLHRLANQPPPWLGPASIASMAKNNEDCPATDPETKRPPAN